MFAGSLALDVLRGDVHSLKEKRSVVQPVVAELRRKFEVAADAGQVRAVLDSCERLLSSRPELEVLSAHQQLHGEDD
jgi:uncharacterized protein YlxP (DUF503 family)